MTNLNDIHIDTNEVLKNIVNKDNQYTIPIFIPHLGCKNECVFCNQRKISGASSDVDIEEVKKLVEERLKSFKQNRKIQIAFFGGSFTGLDKEEQIKFLKLANTYVEKGVVESIRISTRPDYISKDILKLLKRYNVKTIELGVQSMDEEVLFESKRGHTSLDVIRAARLINLYNFELGFQIMVGLPKSTKEKEIETIDRLLKFKPKQLRIYPVYVLKESQLYEMYKKKDYSPLTLEDAAGRVAEVIGRCRKSNVSIIRIGLQSTEDISENAKDLIGPVSDNFGEYALSKIVQNEIIKNIPKEKEGSDEINIYIPKRYISLAVGPKKANKKYLEERYNKKINIIGE